MKYEPYADKGRPRNYAILELVILCLLLAVLWGWQHAQPPWWNSFSPANRRFIEGVCLEAVAVAFLWLRVKRGHFWRLSPWELKFLLLDFAMLIGGIVCFAEAAQMR